MLSHEASLNYFQRNATIQSKFSDHNEITFGFSETTQLNNIMLSLPYFCDFTQMCCYRAFLIGWLMLMMSLKKKISQMISHISLRRSLVFHVNESFLICRFLHLFFFLQEILLFLCSPPKAFTVSKY